MAILVTFNGVEYEIPTTGDLDWGGEVTSLLEAMAVVVRNTTHAEEYPTVATFQSTVDALPLRLDEDAFIYLPAGNVVGAELSGFTGAGALNIVGTTSLATVTTGSNSGTAGVGTSSTSLVKPTGANNWTSSDLANKFLKLTGGGGTGDEPTRYPVLRPILANTTTSATVESVPGMDSTTTFQIVDLAAALVETADEPTSLVVRDNIATVVLRGLNFADTGLDTLVDAYRNQNVVVDGCKFNTTANEVALKLSKCTNVTLSNCLFASSADALIERCGNVDVTNVKMQAAGQIEITDSQSVEIVKLESASAVGQMLELVRVLAAQCEVKASNGGATPIRLESVAVFEAWGSNKLTGSGNTGYGVQVDKSGRYTFTGSNITGSSGDVLFMNAAATWANMSSPSFGIYEEYAASAIANASYTKAITRGPRLYEDAVDFSSRVLEYGYHNFAQATGITAAGSSQSDATQLSANFYNRVSTVAASTGVKLPNGAALPGVLCYVKNTGANTLTVYSSDVAGTIDGGASTTINAGAKKLFMSTSDDGLSWDTVV